MVTKILSSRRKRTSKIESPFTQATCHNCGNERHKCNCHPNPNCECDVSHEGSCYDPDDLPSLPQIRIPNDNHYDLSHSTPLLAGSTSRMNKFLDKNLESKSKIDDTVHETPQYYEEKPIHLKTTHRTHHGDPEIRMN